MIGIDCKNTIQGYRPDIDGLRAFAVLSVLAYHAFPAALSAGFIGVDVFFVISGYLICGIILRELQQGTFSFWNFYSRRIRRIFPALIIVLAVSLFFGWHVLLPGEYSSLGKHVFGGSFFIANFLLWLEAGYFDVAVKAKPLLHLWSLGIEEQFYILFPLLLVLCAKKCSRPHIILIILCSVSFLYNIHCLKQPVKDFYSPLARAWELLAGAALCAIMRRPATEKVYRGLDSLFGNILRGGPQCSDRDGCNLSLALALLGVVLLGFAFLLVQDGKPYPGKQALLPVLSTICLIAAGLSNPINRLLLANRLVVFVGLISYPLYLWHWIVISYAFIINGELHSNTLLIRIGLIILSFMLAIATYFMLEKPIRFKYKSKKIIVYILLYFMAIIGFFGIYIYFSDGVYNRENIKDFNAYYEELEHFVVNDTSAFAYAGNLPKNIDAQYQYTSAHSNNTVAIFGDSHALSAYYGIAEVNKKIGNNTFLISRSSSMLPILSLLLEDNSINKKITLQYIDIINKKEDITSVFIFCRGPWIYDDYAHLDEFKGLFAKYTPGEMFAKSLQLAVNALKKQKIFIVTDNPRLPNDIRYYLPRPYRGARKIERTQHDVLHMQHDYRVRLNTLHGATIIDSIDVFCPDGQIVLFDMNGLPLYKDHDHLSQAGSVFQAVRLLAPYLRQAARGF